MNVFRLAQFIDSLHILLLHVDPNEECAVLEQNFEPSAQRVPSYDL